MGEEKKDSLVTIGVFIIFIIVIAVVVMLSPKKENEPVDDECTECQEEQKTVTYHIEEREKYTVIGIDDESEVYELSYSYPVIDGNNDEYKKINEEIVSFYENAKNDNADMFSDKNLIEDSETAKLFYVIKDKKKYYIGQFDYIYYNVTDNENYLAVFIEDQDNQHASGSSEAIGYVIDKNTNKILTNEEIVEKFNLTAKEFVDYYNNNTGCEPEGFGKDAKSIDDIKIYVNGNKLGYHANTCCCSMVEYYSE